MAEDKIEYKAPTDAAVQSLLSEAQSYKAPSLATALSQREVTGDPGAQSQKVKYIQVDENAPLVAVPEDATKEEMQDLLKNPELEKRMYDQGFIYKYGVGAERYNNPDDLNDTAFMKGLKGGWTGLKTIGAGALGTIADLVGAEGLEEATNDAIQRYQLEGQAKQYIETDDGEIIPFSTSIEQIMGSEERFKDFYKWLTYNVGQGLVTTIPILAASYVNPLLGVGAAYGMGVGDTRIAQLEATGFKEANAGLSLAAGVPYAAAERFFGAGYNIGKLLRDIGEEGGKEALEKVLKESTTATISKTVGKTMVGEGIAEGSQEIITSSGGTIEGAMNEDKKIIEELGDLYTDKNFWKQVGEASAAGAAGGGPFGIVGGVAQRSQIKSINDIDLGASSQTKNIVQDDPELKQKLGDDYKDLTFTMTGVGTSLDRKGKPILDRDDKPITPRYQVKGIYNVDGNKTVVLKDLTPGAGRTFVELDYNKLNLLNAEKKSVKTSKQKELNPETGQVIDDTPIFDKQEDYTKINVKPLTAAQRKKSIKVLKSRGYTDNAIETLEASGPRALLIEAESQDSQNYLSPQEIQRLGELGYLEETADGFSVQVPRGGKQSIFTAQKINEVLNNTALERGTGKTVGRALIDDILENNIENKTTPLGREQVGTRAAVPPSSPEEIVNNSDEKIAAQLSKIGDDLRTKKLSDKQREEIIEARDILNEASAETMFKPAIDRRYAMESLANRIGDGGTPAAIIGYEKAIQGLRNRKGITEQDRAEQIRQFQDRISSAQQDLRDFNILYTSFGYKPLTRDQLNKVRSKIFPNRKGIAQTYQGTPATPITKVVEVWQAENDSKVDKARERQRIVDGNKLAARQNETFLGNISNTFWNLNGGFPGNKPANNADLAVIYIMPRTFNALALRDPDLTMARQLQRQIAYAKEGDNGITPPYLELKIERREDGTNIVSVLNHEGRGRANWADSLNPDKPIPVLIKVNEKGKVYKNQKITDGDSFAEVRDKVFRNPNTVYENEGMTKIDDLPDDQIDQYNPRILINREVPITGFIHNTNQKFGPIFRDDYPYNPFKMDVQMMNEFAPRYKEEMTKGMPRIYMALRNELDRLGLSYVNLKIVNRFLDDSRAKGKFTIHQDIVTEAINMTKPQIVSILNSPKGEYGGIKTTMNSQLATLRHEAMHAMIKSGFFTDKELKMLKDYSKKVWMKKYNIKNTYAGQPNASEELYIEEGITFAFADYMANKYAAKGLLAQVFERMKGYLMALGNALRGLGFTSGNEIFNQIDQGMFAERVAEYKRLQQNNIRINNSILNKTYGKATFETQIVTGTASLSDLVDAPISQSNHKNSLEFIDEPSSPDIDEYIPGTRQTLRKEMREMSNDIKSQESEESRGVVSEKGLGTFSRIFSHARVWAKRYPIFEKLYTAVHLRDQKTRELQSKFVERIQRYLSVMRNPEAAILLTKAMEISQQVPGRYRRNERNQIVFVAERDGDGANSQVKAGDVITLDGDVADAYENAMEGIQFMHAEIVRGLLASDPSNELLNDAISFIISNQLNAINMGISLNEKTFLNNTKNITELTDVDFENLSYEDILQITTAVQNLQSVINDNPEILANQGVTTEQATVLSSRISRILGSQDREGAPGTGMLALTTELKKYEDFKKTDYVPLQRHGSHFIVVRDKDNNVVEYRLFEKRKFSLIVQDEEKQVREELEAKYRNNPNVTISDTRRVDIAELRDRVGADLATIDAAAGFISDTNKDVYNEIRKEIETVLNKGTNLTNGQVRGFSAFVTPRKQQGGVPGYSTDFARAISQYGLTGSNFAAGNRFNSTIGKAWRGTQDPIQNPNSNLREASNEWYQYVLNPKHELAGLRRLGFWYYLGGNISSAFLQLMSVVQFSGPILSTISGKRQSAAIELSKAFKDVMKMLVFNGRRYEDVFINFDKLPDDVKDDALADVFSGVIKQGMAMHEAGMPQGGGVVSTNQVRQRNLRTFENTIIGGIFNTFETIARLTAYIAAHRMMQQTDAMESAVDFFKDDADFQSALQRNNGVATPRMVAQQVIEETFGVYGKLNRPKYMRGWGSVFFLFQTYISQMFSLMFRMFNKKGPAGKKALAKMLLMIALTGGLLGLPGMDEVAWLRDLMRKITTGVDGDTRSELRQMLSEVSSPKVAEFFENGVFNALANVDVQRRLSFGNVPGSAQIRAIVGMMGINTGARAEEFLGAPGAILFQNSRNFIGSYSRTGEFPLQEFLYAVTPTFLTNYVKAFDAASDGRVESRYGTVLTDDATVYDAFLQAIGFTPTKVSKERELVRLEKLNVGKNSLLQSRMNAKVTQSFKKIYNGMIDKDFNAQLEGQEDLREVINQIFVHNSKHDLAGQLQIDVPRLAQEALKDIIKEYRLLSNSSKAIPSSVADANALGVPYNFNTSN